LGGSWPTLFSVRPLLSKFMTIVGTECNEISFESKETGVDGARSKVPSRPKSKWEYSKRKEENAIR
jgi:hypothetical protein